MCPWSFVGKRRMGMQVVVFSCKLVSGKQRLQFQFLPNIFPALSVAQWGVVKRVNCSKPGHTYITMFSNPALFSAQWGAAKRVSKPIRLKAFYKSSTVWRSEKESTLGTANWSIQHMFGIYPAIFVQCTKWLILLFQFTLSAFAPLHQNCLVLWNLLYIFLYDLFSQLLIGWF